MAELGSGTKREIQDFMLTHLACCLVAQNGDPKIEEIAFAQGYFVVQTRKVEMIEEHLNLLSRLETIDKLRVAESKRIPILKRSEEVTSGLISDIRNGSEKRAPSYCRLSERMHQWLFTVFFGKAHEKFSLENNCVNCGVCAKVCPINNITLAKDTPLWGTNCVACHACVHWCPQNAIHLGKSKGRLQYHPRR